MARCAGQRTRASRRRHARRQHLERPRLLDRGQRRQRRRCPREFTYDEAGYFRFKAFGVYDDTFAAASGDLNKNDCIVGSFSNSLSGGKYGCNFGNAGVSDHFGRFIPDHFDTVVTQACLAGNFTYSGQPIPLTVTARNAGGGITQNYSDAFSRQLTLTARDLADSVDNPGPGAFVSTLVAAGSFAGGRAGPTPTPSPTPRPYRPTCVSALATAK